MAERRLPLLALTVALLRFETVVARSQDPISPRSLLILAQCVWRRRWAHTNVGSPSTMAVVDLET